MAQVVLGEHEHLESALRRFKRKEVARRRQRRRFRRQS